MTRAASNPIALLACLLPLLAACATSMPRDEAEPAVMTAGGEPWPPAPEPQGSVEDYERRIAELQQDLGDQLASADTSQPTAASAFEAEEAMLDEDLTPAPESSAPTTRPPSRCEVAADLRDRICDLAGRICALSGEHGDDTALRDKCVAADGACEEARAGVRAQCG